MAVPKLERQQLPDLLGAVLVACLLIGDQAGQRVALDHSAAHKLASDKHVLDNLVQVIPDPRAKRSAERRLGTVQDLGWQPLFRRPLERDLALSARDLGLAIDREGGCGYQRVDERHSDLTDAAMLALSV